MSFLKTIVEKFETIRLLAHLNKANCWGRDQPFKLSSEWATYLAKNKQLDTNDK